MLFNSLHFAVFCPIVLAIYFALPFRFRNHWLLVASYYFYMSWNPWYGFLLFYVTATDFIAAKFIGQSKTQFARRVWLILSLVSNLGMLFYFKYYNFFAENANFVLDQTGSDWQVKLIEVLLPVGISFHTFQSLSYTFDVYRRTLPVESSFWRFALYVSFFPQLVAGPIERSAHFLPQLHKYYPYDPRNFELGSRLIIWGFFKKLVIADRLALVVDEVYAVPSEYSSFWILIAMYAFAMQIYCDFSGYSDIAQGIAKLMGYDLMDNFRQPYFTTNIRDFWSRWHISLSTWFRDYLYVPLGGNRKGLARQCLNLAIVFLVSGLWHGASWNFVTWGCLHGIAIVGFQLIFGGREMGRSTLFSKLLGWFVTFHFVVIAWVFFRADFQDSLQILSRLFDPAALQYMTTKLPQALPQLAIASLMVALLVSLEWLSLGQRFDAMLQKRSTTTRVAIQYLLLFCILNFGMFMQPQQFIYFQF
ncbi:MAG: MBOAT family O-acyltransferase [Pirellulaceae bacterium]